jgi:urease subunit alpha
MARISRKEYAQLYGPTKGDGVRLGDTSLIAEIEHDYAVPGDECLHGGGKTLRDGLGLTPGYDSAQGALDMLISNAVIIDPVLGVVKGDIGIKDGKIVAVGKAGNPATMDGVHPRLICGAATRARCEGLIATPGGIDARALRQRAACRARHRLGLTTMIRLAGTDHRGIDCGGEWNVGKMRRPEQWPMNFGFWAGQHEQSRAPTTSCAAAAWG